MRYRKESDGNRVTITNYYCNLVRREIGKKQRVKVSHRKGISNHTDHESCVAHREVRDEALTGEPTGQPFSRERDKFALFQLVANIQNPRILAWFSISVSPNVVLVVLSPRVAVLPLQIAYPCRRMPSAWMREASVVGFMPSSCAAPRSPETRPPLARRAVSMLARS